MDGWTISRTGLIDRPGEYVFTAVSIEAINYTNNVSQIAKAPGIVC